MKCSVCKKHEREWTWQPCGPDESPLSFTTPGSHYRGFPAVPVCDECKTKIEAGEAVMFSYRISGHAIRRGYVFHEGKVEELPF